jgi:DNA-binding GntR family transcriptional regulator
MSTRSQTVTAILTKAILDHRLVPGCKLGERELSEIFNVSRIVIRQALIRLADDGLASIERNRGAFVAKPSLQEALELYDALTLVEQGVAAQLSERLGAAGWNELRQHVERQRQAVQADNHGLADQLGQEFHTLFVRLSRNRVMQDIHAQLIRRTTLLRSLIPADFDYCNLLDDHVKLIDLLERGRLKQAMELIGAHHNAVVRGYIMDRPVHRELTPREALAPYLEDSAESEISKLTEEVPQHPKDADRPNGHVGQDQEQIRHQNQTGHNQAPTGPEGRLQ